MDYVGIIAGVCAGLAGSLIGWILLNGYFYAELQNMKRQINRGWGTATGEKGISAREERDAEWNAALSEAGAILQSPEMKGADGKLDVMKAGVQLAQLPLKYPKAGKAIYKELKALGPALKGM